MHVAYNSRSSGHSSTVVHTLLMGSITNPFLHSHPGLHRARQTTFGCSHVWGQAEAQSENVCPAISQTHTGQHSPSGTMDTSPGRHLGMMQLTAAQLGPLGSGTHIGQHAPSGVTTISPILHTGRAQSTSEQSGSTGTQVSQQSPSRVTG